MIVKFFTTAAIGYAVILLALYLYFKNKEN